MEIKILFDRKRLNRTFLSGWGVSYLIGNKILFDTGEKSGCLLNNMGCMGVMIDDIEAVVVSHDHFDHAGGLWDLLQKKPELDLYVCGDFSQESKNRVKSYSCRVIEANSFTKIVDNVYTTGQMEGRCGLDRITEQALVLETEKGLTIVAGCAHPGIITIVELVTKHTKKNIYLVMGGFHLMDTPARKLLTINNKLKRLGVQCVGPAHCTGEDAEKLFKESYRQNFLDIRVGNTIEV